MTTPHESNPSRVHSLKTSAFILTLIAALVLCIPALAQSNTPPTPEPLVLTDQQGQYVLGRSMDILEDPGGKLTIDDVASPEFTARFVRSQVDVPIYGYSGSAYWARLQLRNEARLTDLWWLEVVYPGLEYVDLYTPLPGGQGFSLKQSGAMRTVNSRDIPFQHVIFYLSIPANSEQTVYLRFQTGSSMTLPLTLWSPSGFTTHRMPYQVLFGIYYGALLAMLAYNLFLLFSLKELNYLYLVIIIASLILQDDNYEGISNVYFFPGLFPWNEFFQVLTRVMIFVPIALFTGSFLEIKTRLPKLQPVMILLVAIGAGLVCLSPFVPFRVSASLIFVWFIPIMLFTGVAIILSWIQGPRYPASYFFIAWIGVIFGVLAQAFVRFGTLPSNPLTEYSYRLGFVWMALAWSFALADRVHQLKAETEETNRELRKSQRQLNQTLEGLPIGVVVYGLDQKLTYLNQRLMDIFNNPEKGVGRELVTGSALPEALKYFSLRVTGSDQAYPLERLPIWEAFNGIPVSVDDVEADLFDRRVPLEIWVSPVKDEQGRIESVVAAVLDITQRKKDEAELTEYRQHLEQLVDDRTGQLTTINEVLQTEITERQRLQDVLNLRLEWLVVANSISQTVNQKTDLPKIYQNFVGVIAQLFSATEAFIAELNPDISGIIILARSAQRDTETVPDSFPDWIGTVIPLPPAILSEPFLAQGKHAIFSRAQLSRLSGESNAFLQAAESQFILLAPMQFQGKLIGLLGLGYRVAEPYLSNGDTALLEKICFDIAQIAEKAQIYEQSREMVAIEERSRLARDLHDSVTQVLFAASLVAEVLPQIWRRDPEKGQASLEELRRLTRGALAEMRTMLLELRPSALVKTPLNDLLAQLTEAATSRTGMQFQLFIENIPSLPEEVHICFYRIAQESLNNIVKHAHASRVEVSLSANPITSDFTDAQRFEVKLVVRDDGRGLAPQENGSPHMGLGIMSERAAAIHATLSVESRAAKGTTVTLTWLT
jgi:signal transduction histidine kinase/PAS domain-containing protein